jgi:protoporphyrinogen oxidase
LRGLALSTLLIEAFKGRAAKVEWLDGTFCYPRLGIGMIAEKLADAAERKNIQLESRITKILHSENSIQEVEINGGHRATIDNLVNTLPLNLFVQMMDPAPPEKITNLAKKLRFRNVILVAVFLDREKVTEAGSMYFPDPKLPFTRVYEPKIRSASMSPPGKTSLICEIPCQREDSIWNATDQEIIPLVIRQLSDLFRITEKQIIGTQVHRISHAYPVLRKGFEQTVNEMFQFLSKFKNLKFAGRGGKFTYTSIHNMMRFGKEIIDEYLNNSNQ